MTGNALLWETRGKKGSLKSISEGGTPSAKTPDASSQTPSIKHQALEIRLAAFVCLIVGLGGIVSSAAVALLFLSGSLGAVPMLIRMVGQFAGRATLFGAGIIGMSLILIIAGYLLLRRSRTGGTLAFSASALLLVLPALSFLASVAIEPFVVGVVVGVVLICLVASGWESLS